MGYTLIASGNASDVEVWVGINQALGNGLRVVRTAIVDDQNFQVTETLAQNTLNSFLKEMPLSETRNDD
nr:hypothetical protein [Thiomonas arsenitoxydans]